ncbi:HAD family hydrolase [Desulfoplanes sp.]
MHPNIPRPVAPSGLPSGIVFTDLDGTLLRSDRTLSPVDRAALQGLKEQGIIRVVATGRSLSSFLGAVGPDFPADYVIFSTGAGVASLADRAILRATTLRRDEINLAMGVLRRAGLDFMLHHPIPDNHCFSYEQRGGPNPDFMTRLKVHEQWGHPLEPGQTWEQASQFVAIIPPWQGLEPLVHVRAELAGLSVIRATSPFDHTSTWVEIFPAQTSKAHAAAWLCASLNIPLHHTMAIGNDYNDLDLLEMSLHPFVVANAPRDLVERFPGVPDNDHAGVARAIAMWMKDRPARPENLCHGAGPDLVGQAPAPYVKATPNA